MATLKKYDLLNLGGGRNDGLPPSQIQDNEVAELVNFYPFGSKLRRRDGVRRITSSAYTEALTSLFAYKTAAGVWTLLVGTLAGMAKLSGNAIVALPVSDGPSYNSELSPWVHFQYKDVAYACRKSTGTLKRMTTDYIQDAGIAAPSAAPTIADGGAGVLTAANYYAVVTFSNSDSGAESNPSTKTTVLALGASKQIAWTNIPTSTSGQVNARRLYRTLPGQAGEYYFVGQINDNFTTTFTDNVAVADMGEPVSFDNGTPPTGIENGCIWQERGWLTDGVSLFPSEIGLPESYAEDGALSVFPDDGHKILPLLPFGSRLIVGKTNAVHYVVGTDRSSFELRTLSDKHGCFSRYAMKETEGLLFWYGGDNVYRSDGNSVASISTIKVRAILDRIPDAYKQYVMMAVYPRYSWLLLSVPLDTATQNSKVLGYNYKTDAWFVFEHPTTAPAFIGDFFDTSLQHVLYASFYDNHLYQYHDTAAVGLDYGNAINAYLVGKQYAFGGSTLLKGLKRLYVQCTSVAANLRMRVYMEGGSTAIKDRTVSLNLVHEWKRYNCSTLNTKPGSTMQWRLDYAGATPIDISGIAAEVVTYERVGQAV